ncbi:MAG: TlpA family protein disulfide reductase [Arenicellales bacterium WSBS_2016_MAG_OTU3]
MMVKKIFFYVFTLCLLTVSQQSFSLGKDLNYQSHKPTAPVTALEDMHGVEFDIDDYKNQVVLVNFWATWCSPCIEELPTMQTVWESFDRNEFEIIAINAGETRKQVLEFLGKFETRLDFRITLDEPGETFKAWKVRALPASFVVDKQGKTIYKAEGGRDFAAPQIRDLIQKLIDEPS